MDGQVTPTGFGMLLFGEEPRDVMQQAGVLATIHYFLGASDPYKSLKTTLKAEINAEAWESLHSDMARDFNKPEGGRIAVKVINHLGDEVMKVFRVE